MTEAGFLQDLGENVMLLQGCELATPNGWEGTWKYISQGISYALVSVGTFEWGGGVSSEFARGMR